MPATVFTQSLSTPENTVFLNVEGVVSFFQGEGERLYLKFDENGIFRTYELEKSRPRIGETMLPGGCSTAQLFRLDQYPRIRDCWSTREPEGLSGIRLPTRNSSAVGGSPRPASVNVCVWGGGGDDCPGPVEEFFPPLIHSDTEDIYEDLQ